MAKFEPTREQKLAKKYDRHMSIRANAGSGKTKVLIERYLDILINSADQDKQDVHPRDIVALTFTKKAAAEMLHRVTKEVEKKITDIDVSDTEELRKYSDIRIALISARFSTFHSFANSILKDFPLEAGVQPNFTLINDVDNNYIKSRCIRDILEQWLTGRDGEDKKAIQNLINVYGLDSIKQILHNMINSKESFLKQELLYENKDKDYFINLYTKEYSLYINKKIDELIKEFKHYSAMAEEQFPVTEHFYTASNNIISGLNQIQKNMQGAINADLLNTCISLIENDILPRCKEGKIIEKAGRKTINSVISTISESENSIVPKKFEISGKVKELQKLFNIEFEAIEITIEYSLLLYRISADIIKAIDIEKSERAWLGHDDLIIKARDLLTNNENVARQVRDEIKYLMVDEFQDTNQLQYDIVKALVPELYDKNYIGHSPNLFIVGDGKQSIYGFRSADVRVFNHVIEDIKSLQEKFALDPPKLFMPPEKGVAPNDDELKGLIELQASFRMKPVLVAFINSVFNKLMIIPDSEGDDTYFIKYEDLVAGKNQDGDCDFIQELEKGDRVTKDLGNIDLICHHIKSKDEEETEGYDDISEGEAIAQYIKTQVDAAKFNYSDFAILSRTTSKFPDLGEELSNLNIPFAFEGGRSYFDTKEVQVLLAFIDFLYNTNDNLALTTVLKSDYFAINETLIFSIKNLAAEKSKIKPTNLWEAIPDYLKENAYRKDEADFQALAHAQIIIGKLLGVALLLPISSLIYRIEFLTAHDALLENTARQSRITDNIDKFIRIAEDFEHDGYNSIIDFIKYIKKLADMSAEGEAKSTSLNNIVKIMTIHASKGLEFPCVILYYPNGSLAKSPSKISPSKIDEKYGLTFQYKYFDEEGGIKSISTIQEELCKLNIDKKESAEEIRKLYVALTRAETQIAIPYGTNYLGRDISIVKSSYLAMLLSNIDLDGTGLISDDPIAQQSKIDILIDSKAVNKQIKYNINKFIVKQHIDKADIKQEKKSNVSSEVQEEMPVLYIDDLFSTEADMTITATMLTHYLDDKEAYIKRFILGNQNIAASEQTAGYIPAVDSGAVFGSIFHEAISKITDWYDFEKQIIKNEESDVIIKASIAGEKQDFSQELYDAVLAEMQKTISTKLINSSDYDFANSKPEIEFTLPYNDDYLNGILDLLIENKSEGRFEVWDWKTNLLSSTEDMDKKAEYYRPQLLLYSLFLQKLYPEQKEYIARLLFTKRIKADAEDEEWVATFRWTPEELAEDSKLLYKEINQLKFDRCLYLPKAKIL